MNLEIDKIINLGSVLVRFVMVICEVKPCDAADAAKVTAPATQLDVMASTRFLCSRSPLRGTP